MEWARSKQIGGWPHHQLGFAEPHVVVDIHPCEELADLFRTDRGDGRDRRGPIGHLTRQAHSGIGIADGSQQSMTRVCGRARWSSRALLPHRLRLELLPQPVAPFLEKRGPILRNPALLSDEQVAICAPEAQRSVNVNGPWLSGFAANKRGWVDCNPHGVCGATRRRCNERVESGGARCPPGPLRGGAAACSAAGGGVVVACLCFGLEPPRPARPARRG